MQFFDALLNKSLTLDPDLLPKLHALQGNTIEIDITDVSQRFFIDITADGLSLSRNEKPAITTMKGSLFALMKMSFASNTEALKALQTNDIEISGDVEFGLQIKRILQEIHIDWEEHIAYFTGDIVAHQLGKIVGDTKQWFSHVNKSMNNNTKDYLQEEAQFTPPQAEFDAWCNDIQTLQMNVDRITARWQRLQKKGNDV